MEKLNKELLELGKKVFENKENFMLWMNTPNFYLNNEKPIDFLKEPMGEEIIIRELTSMDDDVYI